MKLLRFTPLLLLLLFFSCKKETVFHSVEYKATSSISGFYMEYTGANENLNKIDVLETSIGVMPIRVESGKTIKLNVSGYDTAAAITADILVNGSRLIVEDASIQRVYRRVYTDTTYTDSVMVLNSMFITATVP